MPTPSTTKPAAKKKPGGPNRVQTMQAMDKLPSAGAGQPGMPQGPGMPTAPPPFPFPASQLDRTPSGVPNITGMLLRSFQPAQLGAAPPPAEVGAAQTRNPTAAPPMAQRPTGPRPKRGFSQPQTQQGGGSPGSL